MEGLGHRYSTADDGTSQSEPLPGHAHDGADTVNEYRVRCTGMYDSTVTQLFNEVRRNPQKLDDAEITVACLRKAGLVGADYTERQWRKDYDADTLPFGDFDQAWTACRLDPLGLWREG